MMKKVFLLIGLLGLITSCSLDDEGQVVSYQALPIADYELPESFVYGERYQLPVSFVLPTTCHEFYNFEAAREDSTRFVYAISQVLESDMCTDTPNDTVSTFLNFDVIYRYTYVFKMYKGDDENGEPIYETQEVPVEQP